MPEEFEKEGFTLKTHPMLIFRSVHTTPEEFKNATITGHLILDLCLRKTRSGNLHDYRGVIFYENLRFQNVFHPHENEKPAFSNSFWFEERFRKAPFS